MPRLTPVGWSAVLGALAVLFWSVPGLIVNPDFAVGDAATSKVVLGVDMNGWHAVSGFLVAVPALLAAPRPPLAALVNVASAGALLVTAGWALADTRPAFGLFSFPNQGTDAILHVGTSAIFLAGAAHFFLTSRREGARAAVVPPS